jgi:gluconolactonase
MTFADILSDGATPKILGSGYGFTEGPAADRDGNVYFSDGRNNAIHRWSPDERPTLFVGDSPDPIGMMFNPRGELCVCEGAAYRVAAIDVATRAKRILCDQFGGLRFNEPNDLAIDATGGFYFSDPNYQHHGQPTVRKQDVYYCSAEGRVARVSTICFKPNGVLLSAGDATLYVADARGQVVYAYDVLGPGQLAGERIWIDGLGANPDGMTFDEHDNLYVCCGRAGLKVFDRAGRPLGGIDVHAANCCFGGRDFQTLCIASADRLLGIETKVVGLKPLMLRVDAHAREEERNTPCH